MTSPQGGGGFPKGDMSRQGEGTLSPVEVTSPQTPKLALGTYIKEVGIAWGEGSKMGQNCRHLLC